MRAILQVHAHDKRISGELQRRLAQPSLYDEFLRWLARRGHAIPDDRVDRDFTQPYERSPQVTEAFRV